MMHLRFTAPLRAWAQRFSFFLMILASIALMMIGKVDVVLVEGMRTRVLDGFAPILGTFAAPAATIARVIEEINDGLRVHQENLRLKEDNAHLLDWQQVALRLDAENRSLRALLNARVDPPATFVTARVVAEPGGAFARSVLVMAGRRDGVRRGQAALSGSGLVGRVVDVGEWSARVLLITDLNARIPVMLELARVRAVLGGDNSDRPRLLHIPSDVTVSVGDRIVTSGIGGVFPPGLPVGVISTVNDRLVRVTPLADLLSPGYLRIVDYGIGGGLGDPTTR